MIAQENILRALTEANAAYAPTRQLITDLLAQREARVADLVTSHRALDELLQKGDQGVKFYTKLQVSGGTAVGARDGTRWRRWTPYQRERRETDGNADVFGLMEEETSSFRKVVFYIQRRPAD